MIPELQDTDVSAARSQARLFDVHRKTFVLFLGPFRRALFHQSFEWFLLVLFLSVFTFTHIRPSF